MDQPASIEWNWWGDLAAGYLLAAERIIGDPHNGENLQHPGLWALLARSTAEIYGWDHPGVRRYLDRCLSLRRPGGAYGEHVAWDPFNDGTVNPIDTPYAIVTTDFVGTHLIAARAADVLDQADLDATIDAMLNWPTSHGAPDYSDHPNDHEMPTVWNIVASAATFLLDASGHTDHGRAVACVEVGSAWRDLVVDAYSPRLRGWTYSTADTERQDGPHNAVCADVLRPWMGPEPALHQLADGPLSYGEQDFIGGAVRLLNLPAATEYTDGLVGRVARAGQGLANAGSTAAWAYMCARIQRAHWPADTNRP